VINLAHGSFYMIGAYLAWGLAPLFGDQFLLQLVAGILSPRCSASCSNGHSSASCTGANTCSKC
jgi:branched-subunit amino acid ABC-type transport system permease component